MKTSAGCGEKRAGPTPSTSPDLRLREELFEFLSKNVASSVIDRAAELYGAGPDADELAFADWLLHDFELPTGRTPIREYLRRNRGRLDAASVALLENWADSVASLWEVQDVKVGVGVHLKDLVRGGECFVNDVRTSDTVVKWDVLLARVTRGSSGRNEFSMTALGLPQASTEAVRELIEAECRGGKTADEVLRSCHPLIRRRAYRQAEHFRENLRIRTPEGDEMVFSKARWAVRNKDALAAALSAHEEFEKDGDGFAWLEPEKPDSEGRRSYGSLRFEDDRLLLETISRQRLTRGKALVNTLAGSYLKGLPDEFRSVQEAMADKPPASKMPEPDIPDDVKRELVGKVLAKHYATWPDERLPALGGKTPREAVKTPDGRAAVEKVLRSIENGEERNRRDGRPFYDVNILRRELRLI